MPSFDFAPLLAYGLPPPAGKWAGFAKYNFIGGHNAAEHVPVDDLIQAASDVLKREGTTLATYGLSSVPLGYRPRHDAGNLRPVQRPARLSAAARVFSAEAETHRRDFLRCR